jgi:hypothetical protein
MAWRRTAQRVGLSAVAIVHISALMIWTMPTCAIKQQFEGVVRYYMLPSGLWQWWAMFAPNPLNCTVMVDAEVVDAQGMRHVYEFPRLAELPWWRRVSRYRQPKFGANLLAPEYTKLRELASRHAVRQLGLGPEVFPVWVSLYCELKDPPPPGIGAADPMAPTRIQVLDRFQFASLKEVRP